MSMKRFVKGVLAGLGVEIRRLPSKEELPFPEASSGDIAFLEKFSPYTMSSVARQWALLRAIDYVDANSIPGDIVECGVWRGGNMMMASARRSGRDVARQIYLFDTFAGMSEPTDADVSLDGVSAKPRYLAEVRDDHNEWCFASIEDVRSNFDMFGLAEPTLIKGKVEDTLLDEANLPNEIAVLRLDTDWYESTRAELEILYPRLARGGVLIVDDYGHWQGARRAVDEYFGERLPLLMAADYTCRVAVKI